MITLANIVSLDMLEENESSHYWKAYDIQGYKVKEEQTMHIKVQWKNEEKSCKKLEIIKCYAPKQIFEYAMKKMIYQDGNGYNTFYKQTNICHQTRICL